MAFDAGAIVAHLDIKTDDAVRKVDDFEKKLDHAARDRHVRLDATFDDASIGKARGIFAQLDNQLSRDAAQRLRSSPQGSVLGSLNALFSPHAVSGSTTAQQAVSQGMLGQVAKQTARSLPGSETTSQTVTDNVTVKDQVRRSFLSGLFGRGGGGGGGAAADQALADAAGGGGGRGSFLSRLLFGGGGASHIGGLLGGGIGGGGNIDSNAAKNILGGIGANIGGLSTKLTAGIGIGGSLLGAIPALGGVLGAGAGVAGIAGLAVGGLLQHSDVKSAFKGLGDTLKSTLSDAVTPLVPAVTKAVKLLTPLLKSLEPEIQGIFKAISPTIGPIFANIGSIIKGLIGVFKAAAPAFGPFINGLLDLVKNILPPLAAGIKNVAPFLGEFGKTLGVLGKDLGSLFDAAGPAIKASMVILDALLKLVGGLIPVIIKLGSIFAEALAPAFLAFAGVIKELEPVLTIIGHVLGALSQAIISDLVSAFTAVVTLIRDVNPSLQILAKALEQVFNVLENSGLFAVLGDALENVAPLLAKLVNALVGGLAPVLPQIIGLISSLSSTAIKVLSAALTAVIPLLTILIKAVLQPILPLITALIPLINLLGTLIGTVLLVAVKILTPVLGALVDVIKFLVDVIIGSLLDAITRIVQGIDYLGTHWREVWSDIKHWAEDAWNFLTHGWGQYLVPGLTAIRDAVSFLSDHWTQIWGDITSVAKGAWDTLDQDVFQLLQRVITQDIPQWFQDGVSAISRAWTDIQQAVAAPINWVIQHPIDGLIHAFDWISSKVGGPTIPSLAPIQLSHGGRLGGFGGGDVIPALLEPGETVVDKHRSQRFAGLFAAMGVPGYNKGGILHDIGSFFGDLFHGGGILAALVTGNVQAAQNDFMKLLGGTGVGGAVGDLAGLLTAIPVYLVKSAIHDLVGLFTAGGGGPGGGIAGNVGSYRGVILRVLAMLGQPSADLGVVERQMTTESGGNPDIVNKWDINWKEGHPSVGLMQVIQGTFDAYAGPFRNVGPFLYGVSTNPLANIFAGLNYALHAYGPGWTSVLGQGHGYDSGGWLKPGWALNMTSGREAVLTNDQSQAFMDVAEAARQLKKRGPGGGAVMRDAYFQLPEGATVARALSDLTFKLNTMTQEAGVMTP